MTILYEDNHIIAINKTTSEIVQGDKTGDIPLCDLVKAYIKEKYAKAGEVFIGVVHRIDRPVSGVVLFARTSKALERLNEMFATQQIRKTYWAIVKNAPPAATGRLEHYLVRNEKQNKSYAGLKPQQNAKHATLSYRTLSKSDNYCLLEIELETGRHHQIRAQFAAIGCPIKGDLKYGFARSNPDGGICLHARKVEFTHPVAKTHIEIVAPTPENEKLWKILS